jgi:hypothetical protein
MFSVRLRPLDGYAGGIKYPIRLLEVLVNDDAGLVVDNADLGRFLTVIYQTLFRLSRVRRGEMTAHHLAVEGIYP